MKNYFLHSIINSQNGSEMLTAYSIWFDSPNFQSMLMFFLAAAIVMAEEWHLGRKA
ncbi:hypothetical protein [uncultured Cedecea sp.]|uniref:hypothetical protein n=1 Tax=uncultured Cedecea sp. TaxID=988762 RepID=UPI002612E298|nr:hypothetical protein [uncultured Cedecea sp.]